MSVWPWSAVYLVLASLFLLAGLFLALNPGFTRQASLKIRAWLWRWRWWRRATRYWRRPWRATALILPVLFLIPAAVFLGLGVSVAALTADNGPGDCRFYEDQPYTAKGQIVTEKIQAFRQYQDIGLSLSQATQLDSMQRFEASIRKNLSFPYAVRLQRYNYVITDNCDIILAEWHEDDDPLDDVLRSEQCLRTDFRPLNRHKTMINWFPEEPEAALSVEGLSPCWFEITIEKDDGTKEQKKAGLLDAISKHFMLAQGPGSNIDDFKPADDPNEWLHARVAYAGEIFVDLDKCTFWLNNSSGTYKPLDEYLSDVNEFVANQLGRESKRISNVPPWCP